MTVDYRSLFVRVQRGVPNHLTSTHTLDPPRIASTGSYGTSSYRSIRSPGRRNTPPKHIANETKMSAKAPERLWFRIHSSIPRNRPTVSANGSSIDDLD